MEIGFKTALRRRGRFYQSARRYMQRKEVLVSTNVILTLFFISFFAAFAIRPTAITISRLWREIQDKQRVRSQLGAKISNLEEAKTSLEEIEDELGLLAAALPETSEFSRMLRTIEYLTAKHGLVLTSGRYDAVELYLQPSEASASGDQLNSYAFSLSLKGALADIKGFVNDFERLDREVSISSITLKPAQKQEQSQVFDLDINLELETYSYLEAGGKAS